MSTEGFVALAALVLAAGAAVAMSYVPRNRRLIRYPRGPLYVRYHCAGWSAVALAALLVWRLWRFEPDAPPAAEVLRLGPASGGAELLLVMLFLGLGSLMQLLVVLQLALCTGIVWPARGHRKVRTPPADATRSDSPLALVVFAIAVWLPALLGYEATRDTRAEIGPTALLYDGFWGAAEDRRGWDEVARLEYRPWWSHYKGHKLHHSMALVFVDGAEWSFHDDRFWGLDDARVRDRLRALAAAHGVRYEHVEAGSGG